MYEKVNNKVNEILDAVKKIEKKEINEITIYLNYYFLKKILKDISKRKYNLNIKFKIFFIKFFF